MKSSLVLLVALVPTLAACHGDPKVVVRASMEEGATAGIEDLPVRLLPYDRDAILDSLRAKSRVPEPQVPADLVQQMQSLPGLEQQARARGDTAVTRFQAFRRVVLARADSMRAARKAWADKTYARFDEKAVAALANSGEPEQADTTDASGTATFRAKEGRRWVYARYTLPYSELYWNVPVEVTGDSTVVRLTRANAKEKPAL
ncbi:MAG: hypothetical protein JO040_02970 [Gemmatimonadetes bacterium]|nr:hypothetical protein [Gemmatimonadota bacterium]